MENMKLNKKHALWRTYTPMLPTRPICALLYLRLSLFQILACADQRHIIWIYAGFMLILKMGKSVKFESKTMFTQTNLKISSVKFGSSGLGLNVLKYIGCIPFFDIIALINVQFGSSGNQGDFNSNLFRFIFAFCSLLYDTLFVNWVLDNLILIKIPLLHISHTKRVNIHKRFWSRLNDLTSHPINARLILPEAGNLPLCRSFEWAAGQMISY